MKSDRFVLLTWGGMVFQQCGKNFEKWKEPLSWCSNEGTTNVDCQDFLDADFHFQVLKDDD